MSKRKEIEAEFDEPLREVIVGMREQGCSWSTIAGALGVSRRQVYVWRHDLGIKDDRRLCDSPMISKIERAARRLGYKNAGLAITDLRFGGLTLAQTAEALGVVPRTVTRHYPPGFAGLVFVRTERYLDGCRRAGRKAVERRRRRKAQNPAARWRSL